MSSKFESALKNTISNETSLTENGAFGFKTAGNPLLDLHFAVSSLRSKTEVEITKMFSDAFYFDAAKAIKWLFMARDIRGGLGERRTFRICFKWLAETRPEIVNKLISLCAEYSRFDDLFCLVGTKCEDNMVAYIDDQWTADYQFMKKNKPISLLAKWMPSCNTSSADTRKLAKFFCKKLDVSEKKYRQTLSAMRKYLDVIEQKMSAKEWNAINYESVPSCANIKYKNAFLKNDRDRRTEYLNKLSVGEAKINSTACFPSDIVHAYNSHRNGYYSYCAFEKDEALEAMWKSLPNYVKDVDTGSTICVCDSSGSMETTVGKTKLTAMEVAYSLGIYFAEKLTGPFKDKTITFSHSPKYLDMSNAKTLAEKLSIMYRHSEVADTNIEAVFDLLLETAVRNNLSQKDLPSNILIISDMEMNAATGSGYYSYDENKYNANQIALFKIIEKKWNNANYKMPRLVFFNVASRTNTVPLQNSPSGVALVSGYSPAIAKMIFSSKLDPYEVLIDALNADRYDAVENAIKDII